MPRPVYSTQFVVGQLDGTTTSVSYTVPGGMVAVIKDVTIVRGTSTPDVGVWVITGPLAMGIWSLDAATPEYHWHGMQVVNAGGLIRMSRLGGQFAGAISGYLLTVT